MHDDLAQARRGADGILEILRQHRGVVDLYILVPFNDPEVGPVTATSEPEKFKESLRSLRITSGGDCPELSLKAIQLAIMASKPLAHIYVFTDASSKDYYLLPQVLALIQRKQSKVVFVLTGDCDDTDKISYQAYEQIAATSLGQVFHLNKTHVKEVLDYVRKSFGLDNALTAVQKVDLLSVNKPNASKEEQHKLYIDESVKEFTVSLSGKNSQLALVNPEGEDVKGPPKARPLLNLEHVIVLNVDQPEPGEWKVKVSSDSAHTVRTKGLSEINFFYGFSRIPTDKLKETSHRPLKGTYNSVLIRPTHQKKISELTELKLIDMKGNTIQKIMLKPTHKKKNLYRGTFMPPNEFFYLEVNGIDKDGYPLKRITPTAIDGQMPDKPVITADKMIKATVNRPVVLRCQIESLVPFSIRWIKDNQILKRKEKYEQSAESILELRNVTLHSEGNYQCIALNTAGSANQVISLKVTGPPPVVSTVSSVTSLEGENVMLDCKVESDVGYNRSWTRAYGFNESKIQHVVTSERLLNLQNGSLLVKQVKEEDQGVYICIAENAGGKSSAKSFLKIKRRAILSITPTSFEFTTSQTIHLQCMADNDQAVEVVWVKNGEDVTEHGGHIKIINNTRVSELIILNATSTSEGAYKCLCRTCEPEAAAVSIGKYVEEPTAEVVNKKLFIKRGDSVTMACLTKGKPRPSIQWLHDRKTLSHTENEIGTTAFISIYNATNTDEGIYICTVENRLGTAQDSTTLHVGDPPKFILSPTDTKVEYAKNATISCAATGLPEPKVKWQRKDGIELDKKRFSSTLAGTLQITNASLGDEAVYLCTAENLYGSLTAEFHLKITGIYIPVIDDAGNHQLTVTLGKATELTCEVQVGVPEPKISWYKDGETLDTEQMSQEGIFLYSNGSLVIPFVTHEHDGAYDCEAKNAAGVSTKSILLTVIEPPSFKTNDIIQQKVNLGEETVVLCEPEGNPKPFISWKKDGIPIHQSKNTFITADAGDLVIKNVTMESSGTYVCTATNTAGEAEKETVLFVQAVPVIAESPQKLYAVDGQIVTLNCKSEGIPEPVIMWHRNDIPISFYKKQILFLENNSTIRFLASELDSGTYKCIAINTVGQSSKQITLAVLVPPRIDPPSEELIYSSLGERITLNCHVTGTPQPSIIWRKNENIISNTSSLSMSTDGYLSIEKADLDSAGIYSCDAENNAGVTEKLFYVIVHAPPVIVDNLPPKTELTAGEGFSLSCTAYGSPTPHLSWRRNGYAIVGNEGDLFVTEDNRLTIIAASRQHSGIYTCVAENSEGIDKKNVVVDVLAAPSMMEPEENVLEVTEGDSLVITCPAIDASPPPKIMWLKDGHTIEDLSAHDVGRSLELNSVTLSDTGSYSCVAVNTIGHTSATFAVDVLRPPQFPGPEKIEKHNFVASAQIRLECPANGHPKPQITWQKNGHPITPKTVPTAVLSKTKQFMLINNAKVYDEGTYTCTATNKVGQNEKKFEVFIMVPPTIDGVSDDNVEVFRENTVLLQCPVSGIPEPEIRWSKNGDSRIFIQKENVMLSPDFKILEISKAQSEDDGQYICSTKNDAGSEEKRFNITVLDPPTIEESFVKDKAVTLGDNITLLCRVQGYPQPQVTWLHNGKIIAEMFSNHPTGRFSSQNQSDIFVLEINDIQVSDKGKYSCLASNIAGVTEKDYHIIINVPPKLTEDSNYGEIDTIVGSPLIIKCPADGNPKPDVRWFKDSLPVRGETVKSTDTLYIIKTAIQDSGNYTCVAANNVGNTSRSFQVKVYVPPIIDGNEEAVKYKVKAHDKLELNCTVSGHPSPDLLWYKEFSAITPNQWPEIDLRNCNTTLVIPNVTSIHNGKYSCLAINMAGTAEKKFNVEIEEPPAIIPGVPAIQNHHVKLHHRTFLKCELEGSPMPDYSWYKNGRSLTNGVSKNIYISSDGKQLHLMYALKDDAGLYSCVATNPAGFEQMAFQLKVEVPALWGPWSGWSECSVSCGPGQQVRQRQCSSPEGCHGDSDQWRHCYMAHCQVHGSWGMWSDWSSCSASCGLATRERLRKCNSPTPAYGGDRCQGPDNQQEYCPLPPCPIHGGWSEWSEWGPCSVSCDYGVKYRKRRCSNPSPDYGGNHCQGSPTEASSCNVQKCPVDGGWSEWGPWSTCSATCGLGNKQRFRMCANPSPVNGGAFCKGENLQVAKCVLRSCDNVPMYAALRIRGHLNGENLTDYLISANISDIGSKRSIIATANDVLKEQSGLFPYLTFMLSPVSWNAAYEEDQSNNGYSLTHGKFRQESQIEFLSGEELKIRSIGHGINAEGALQVDIEIDGQVPVIQPEVAIQISPYEEDYVQTGPDMLFAASSSVLKINGLKLPYSWNNTVKYDKHKGTMPYLVENLSADDIGIQYDPRYHKMKYKMSTAIRKKYSSNICPEGFVNDEKHGHCRDVNECADKQLNRCHLTQICENIFGTYRCYCRKGYKSSGIGKRCVDINECLNHPKVCSHHCHNTKGSFRCLCPPGYNLIDDRRTCKVSQSWHYDDDHIGEWVDSLDDEMILDLNIDKSPKRNKIGGTSLPKHFLKSVSSLVINCDPGFSVKNGICEDINECLVTPNVCKYEQTCLNKKGSYICLDTPCPTGYERDPLTNYCLVYCDQRHICNEGAKLTQTVSFMVLTPEANSIQPYQDLMQFSVQGDNAKQLPRTRYRIVENESGKPFRVRLENGQGILYSLKNLGPGKAYRTSVLALSYDIDEKTILHTTKFVVFIDVPNE